MITQQKIVAMLKIIYRHALHNVMAIENLILVNANALVELLMMDKIINALNVIILGDLYIFIIYLILLVHIKIIISIAVSEY